MIGTTRLEAVKDLISVVNFDATSALVPTNIQCPDCKGLAGGMPSPAQVKANGGDEEGAVYCGTCKNAGYISVAGWSLERMSPEFRRNIQDIKHDKRGQLVLTFRNKDAAARELKALLGWDRPDALNRLADGRTMTAEQIEQRNAELLHEVQLVSKERIIADMMALADDPRTSASERTRVLETVAKMRGFLTEFGDPSDGYAPKSLADVYGDDQAELDNLPADPKMLVTPQSE